MITQIRKKITQISLRAQTATELAIFGAILVFVLGLIVKYALNFNFAQEFPMKAFRKAAQMSSGSSNRRFANVIFIEDKDIPDASDPLAIASRSAFTASASTAFNNMLFAEIGYNEEDDLPVTDVFINGKHYYFTTAGFKEYAVPDSGNVRTKITERDSKFDRTQASRFEPGLDPGTAYWQWLPIRADEATIITEDKKNVSVDADQDGKEEIVLQVTKDETKCLQYPTPAECKARCSTNVRSCCEDNCYDPQTEEVDRSCYSRCMGNPESYDCIDPDCIRNCEKKCKLYALGTLRTMDYQEGDIDLTIDSKDIRAGRPTQGLVPNQNMEAKVEPGSQLRREENAEQVKNTVTVRRKDTIERVIQLNCRVPGSCCSADVMTQVSSHADDGDYCDSETGELHVFSKPEFKKTRVWTTPH